MGKVTGIFLIIFGLGIATIFTLGALVDVLIDIPWLNWELFVAIPIWLIFLIISLILIFMGALSFSKKSMIEKMFEKMFSEVGKIAEGSEEGKVNLEEFDDCPMFKLFTKHKANTDI
ncbi:MAG: hypothetical protein ACFFBI_04445 [Promethearchaeota archaeon]